VWGDLVLLVSVRRGDGGVGGQCRHDCEPRVVCKRRSAVGAADARVWVATRLSSCRWGCDLQSRPLRNKTILS